MNPLPELLAPAGGVEGLVAAVENGADAVYLGLKEYSARASAANFTVEELAVLLPYAHGKQVRIYVALNSLLGSSDLPKVLDQLQALSDLKPDGIIVQDPAVVHFVRRYFPDLKLHASTLMTIHNSAGANQLQRMGFQRVVLARELTLEEIEGITANTSVELEIFVHGALCYSYSGLCLASSFRGGRSGLEGRCVQPCRLRFRQGRKEGFFLSCNDLCALPLLSRIKGMKLSALKIEGRLKSADYIGRVVRAYRIVLDASPEREKEALGEARAMLSLAPSRRLTTGFLEDSRGRDVLTPHRGGSSGLWVGTVSSVTAGAVTVLLRHEIRTGDRLRPDSSRGEEKEAFTVIRMRGERGEELVRGEAGERVHLEVQGHFAPGERLFRIGSQGPPPASLWQRIRSEGRESARFRRKFPRSRDALEELDQGQGEEQRGTTREVVFLKIASLRDLGAAFQIENVRVVLPATRSNLEQLAKRKLSAQQKRRFVWSLPPLLWESDLEYTRAAVAWYRARDYQTWEWNNWGHLDLFAGREHVRLVAGSRLNVKNGAALAALLENGCGACVLSPEITREELLHLGAHGPRVRMIVPVYSWPPLFSSRLLPKLDTERPLLTPRAEPLFFRTDPRGTSFLYADRPVNWLAQVPFLRANGFSRFLVDLSDGPNPEAHTLTRVWEDFRRARATGPHSLFNYDRQTSRGKRGPRRKGSERNR
ncbi:MAG TPA: peptidase U32 family protein [Syntrophobacteraceae bacterium]|nr:peptidase U32 family protein [Syntrophobacteraceae bacterium]